MPARDVWLGDLSSALGPAAFGVGQGSVRVRFIDDLAMPPFEECNVRKLQCVGWQQLMLFLMLVDL